MGVAFKLNIVNPFNQWGNSEDRIALVGLGFAAIVAVWTSSNLIVLCIYIMLPLKLD